MFLIIISIFSHSFRFPIPLFLTIFLSLLLSLLLLHLLSLSLALPPPVFSSLSLYPLWGKGGKENRVGIFICCPPPLANYLSACTNVLLSLLLRQFSETNEHTQPMYFLNYSILSY